MDRDFWLACGCIVTAHLIVLTICYCLYLLTMSH